MTPEGYIYMLSLRSLSISPVPRPPPVTPWPQCSSPVRLPLLGYYLRHHPDREFVSFILRGLHEGFHVGFSSSLAQLRSSNRNHPSSLANPQVVNDYLHSETSAGRMIGPLPLQAREVVHCSPIGLVPKGRQSGQWRMIVDLSYPEGRSVNDGIPDRLCSVNYSAMDEALLFIRRLGRGTRLIKVDLKGAYRIVPLHPQDQHLFGVTWEGQVYVDQALPFGLCSAPKLFTAVADAIGWALLEAGIPFHIHYLDDFLFFLDPTAPHEPVLPHILSVLGELRVPVATQKLEGPAEVVTFLGVVIDTERCELRLPEEKLALTRALVRSWQRRRSGRYRDFESLLGHLSHAATVIKQGRTFLRHLFASLKAARASSHFVHLDISARADLLWWEYFLVHWNGTMFFHYSPTPAIHIYTDASGSFGCGGVALLPISPAWFNLQWPDSWSDVDISIKELVPVVIAAAIWGRHWFRLHIRFHSDNMAVVSTLDRRSAGQPLAIHLLRCFYFYSALYQFEYSIEHVPGELNTVADALSRNNMTVFSSFFPQATQHLVPAALMDLLVNQHPDWGSPRWTTLFTATLSTPLPHPH